MTGKGVFGGGSAMSVALRAHRERGWRSSEPLEERGGALPMLGLSILRLAALRIDREEVAEPKKSHAGPTQGWDGGPDGGPDVCLRAAAV